MKVALLGGTRWMEEVKSIQRYFGDRADELFLMNWLWGVREREVSGMIGKGYVLCG